MAFRCSSFLHDGVILRSFDNVESIGAILFLQCWNFVRNVSFVTLRLN